MSRPHGTEQGAGSVGTATGGARWTRVLGWTLTVMAALGGGLWGYRFGDTIGGMATGWLTAVLGAVFCSVLADAAVSRLARIVPRG